MCTLTVELKIPLETEPLTGAPALTFTHWLPIGKENGIFLSEDGVELLLWFDLQSTWWASQPTEDELKNHVNILAHYVRAEVVVRDIAPDLAQYMQSRDFRRSPNESERVVQGDYEKLGSKILKVLLKRVNRLIAYARSVKGQYWLLEHSSDFGRMHGYFQSFEATGSINSGEHFRFQPAVGDEHFITMPEEDRYIAEREWDQVKGFVIGDQRTPLVFELLAGAEQLEGNGYVRSALTEAITALEVAISTFSQSHKDKEKLASIFGTRIGADKLQKQIEHMGLSGTVNYLLPLLLPEKVLPSEVLSGCRDAVAARQNVVHNGQRDVSEIGRFLSSVRAFCRILREYSHESPPVDSRDVQQQVQGPTSPPSAGAAPLT